MDEERADCLPDHAGEPYIAVLERLHRILQPRRYLEIGTDTGVSLALARCATIAVDPGFALATGEPLAGKPVCALYRMASDAFFASVDPTAVLGGPIDMAFLDGLHLCEFLLRDFANTERFCRRNSVIALHDCLPVEHGMAEREYGTPSIQPHRWNWWAGDVWRTLWVLKRHRPDLSFTVLDAPPTGLVLITNLDPSSTLLRDNYAALTREMFSLTLPEVGLARLMAEMQVEPTSALNRPEQITARFWL